MYFWRLAKVSEFCFVLFFLVTLLCNFFLGSAIGNSVTHAKWCRNVLLLFLF